VHGLGGAVLCVALPARGATQAVDAVFAPVAAIRRAARRVAAGRGVHQSRRDDAAKGCLSDRGDFAPFQALEPLRVSTATPGYLLAMKCRAMRSRADFHDETDVRFLLRDPSLERHAEGPAVVTRFYPLAAPAEIPLRAAGDPRGPGACTASRAPLRRRCERPPAEGCASAARAPFVARWSPRTAVAQQSSVCSRSQSVRARA